MSFKKKIMSLFSNDKDKQIIALQYIIDNNTKVKQEQIDKQNRYWQSEVAGLKRKISLLQKQM